MKKAAKKRVVDKDSFESVAKRLGCDPDLRTFDKKLGKIARSKPEQGKPSR